MQRRTVHRIQRPTNWRTTYWRTYDCLDIWQIAFAASKRCQKIIQRITRTSSIQTPMFARMMIQFRKRRPEPARGRIPLAVSSSASASCAALDRSTLENLMVTKLPFANQFLRTHRDENYRQQRPLGMIQGPATTDSRSAPALIFCMAVPRDRLNDSRNAGNLESSERFGFRDSVTVTCWGSDGEIGRENCY
jgi:hypothetical protein